MRPGTRLPQKRKYFHTLRKMDKKEISNTKDKLNLLHRKTYEKYLRNKE